MLPSLTSQYEMDGAEGAPFQDSAKKNASPSQNLKSAPELFPDHSVNQADSYQNRQPHSPESSFWCDVGDNFPSLKGAPSTDYYFACERSLFEEHIPELKGKRILKSDLWDEAKNTDILRWTAEQGALPFGVDIAGPMVHQARQSLAGHDPGLSVADCRELPFCDGCMDLVYSMGTIEHFKEYRQALKEMHRVLKPGGKAIIGVPNLLDPFGRPAMVALLRIFDLYGYGMEKAFSAGQFSRLLKAAGFEVLAYSGILFMPGWLRMLDLWCHTKRPELTRYTGRLVKPFARLYQGVPALRRHGYLLALVVEKPA